MPNYRYQPQDCQRHPGCGCPPQMTKRQPDMAACAGNEHPSRPLADRSIAMAYVPWQQWRGILELEKGFHSGTIFEELNKPFTGGRR